MISPNGVGPDLFYATTLWRQIAANITRYFQVEVIIVMHPPFACACLRAIVADRLACPSARPWWPHTGLRWGLLIP